MIISRKKIYFLLIVISQLLAACGESAEPTLLPPLDTQPTAMKANSPTSLVDTDASDVDLKELGQPFQLCIGESAAVDGLVITFAAVGEESRCPRGVMCVWAGRVQVIVRVEKDGELLGKFELTDGEMTEGDVGQVEISGFMLRLLKVEPYPVAEERIGEGEYVVEMVVE